MRRSMDAMGIDYQVVFPSGMLLLGMHPHGTTSSATLERAYNRWLVERIMPRTSRGCKCLLYLPFNTPEACVELVEKYAHIPRRDRLHRQLRPQQAGLPSVTT